jgi:hypothetical protein
MRISEIQRVPYNQFSGLEHVFLEDSYVLHIKIDLLSVEFSLLVVLNEQHPLYHPPQTNEQYCYRHGRLLFQNVQRVEWLEKSIKPYTDAIGSVDYGNVDQFYLANDHYYLEGDWGKLKITSAPPSLILGEQP